MPLNFGEIQKRKKRSLEDETDYTPRHHQTDIAKLGAVYKAVDQSWGTHTGQKVVDKLKQSNRWDLPVDDFKNVHCNFFTQPSDPNNPDKSKMDYMCRITFSFVATVADIKEEEKAINQYKGWPQTISGFMKQDAQAYCKDVGMECTVTFSDVTKKFTGADVMVNKQPSNLCAPATANVNRNNVPQYATKSLYTLTKVYKITVK